MIHRKPITLSVLIPCYNEAATIDRTLDAVLALGDQIASDGISIQIVAVDDASKDATYERLTERARAAGERMVVAKHHVNRGKGAAIQTARDHATGDVAIIQDADLEYDPRDVPRLLGPLLAGEADVVYGSRFRRERPQVHRTMHFLVNRTLTALSNLLSGIYLSDMETCYKVFPSDLLKAMNLRSKRFGFEVESTAYISKVRVRIHELPISYFPRTRLSGKKITWRDGVAALGHLVVYNLLTPASKAFTGLPERYRPEPEA
jgi:glycosyltransferase involved in cell wall biosynthesis